MADPVIVLPDAEKAVTAYLRGVQAVAVGTRNPPTATDTDGAEFVRVRRIGGTVRARRVDAPTFDVLVWAADDERRMAIALDVRAQLHAAVGTAVGGVRLGGVIGELLGPRRMPDPGNPQAEVVMFTIQLAMTAGQEVL